MTHGGKLLVDALNAHGVKRISCVAGESYLPVLDALLDYPEIKVVTCRQESGAAFMAESWGAFDVSSPGVVMVTRGPGACNASIGLHAAMQASTPMIMFVGLINTNDKGREAFQEFDLAQMFGSLSKWAVELDDMSQITEYVERAFHIATSGRPGPVVIGLPEDVLFPNFEGKIPSVSPKKVEVITPDSDDMNAAYAMLRNASKPMILVGGSNWSDKACADLGTYASSSNIPVVTSFRRQDILDNNHDCYIGELGTGPNPKLLERVEQADVVLVLNARVNEMTTQGYALLSGKNPNQKIIHIFPERAEFGKGCTPDLAIHGHIQPTLDALNVQPLGGEVWDDWRVDARSDYVEWTDIDEGNTPKWNGADVTQIYAQLRKLLPDDAIITTDAGNFSGWAQRYLRYGRPGRLFAPVSGAMGYAVPSAVGASIVHPDRVVVGICGDGGFMMSSQELATALQNDAIPIILLFNNGVFGTIKMHQQREYPDRISATDLSNPDFVALGKSYGAFAARVEDASEFTSVWQDALASKKAALIEICMDPAQVTTRSKP